eukprot:TRINITY_DN1845_c2_g2_i1.p1 TRINITY_DN1845_c2_g2~~TRINITY_DN1845_c2_g2_i1.p1  ORF type:complete len:503 (+),score=74.39 TRINITY_DN1845_c2_g2_i1:110-1618(+)
MAGNINKAVCVMLLVWLSIWLVAGGSRWGGDDVSEVLPSAPPKRKESLPQPPSTRLQFKEVSIDDDPISVDVSLLTDPGDVPVLEKGKSPAAYAATLAEYEIDRIDFIRAQEASNRSRSKLYRCLSDGVPFPASSDTSKLWESRTPEHLKGEEHQLPLTESVQKAIWEWQHPSNCKTSRFLVWRLWNAGLGADLHTLAQALSFAMSKDRVLVIDTSAVWWYAMDRYPATLECFFVSPSSCTMSDIGPLSDIEILNPNFHFDVKKNSMVTGARRQVEKGGARTVANPLRSYADVGNDWKGIPRPEWKDYGYQWWMAQSIRYLLRGLQPWFKEKYDQWVKLTFPQGMPTKLLGIHVRHGDKYKEMRLIPFSKYMVVAENLRSQDPELKSIFLSTEDPGVIKEALAYSKSKWDFYYTDVVRSNEGSPREYALLIGTSLLGEISFTNLLIQEQCTHWIGTDSSNWNRLINELRLTSGKYNNTYVQLNKQKCHGSPGLETNGWIKGC